ncbi:MAG: DUF952 domain-containing protein [Pseudomonadota bacterium]
MHKRKTSLRRAIQPAKTPAAMSIIFKIMTPSDWQGFKSAGIYGGSAVDLADGFIHFSTREQLLDTLNKHYEGQTPLYVVEVDPAKLDASALKWEPARDSLFPHLYADLGMVAVVRSTRIQALPNGSFSAASLDAV